MTGRCRVVVYFDCIKRQKKKIKKIPPERLDQNKIIVLTILSIITRETEIKRVMFTF